MSGKSTQLCILHLHETERKTEVYIPEVAKTISWRRLTNLLAIKQSDVSHLSSHNNYLRQLNYVCADRVKYILQFVYDRYEGLHELRY